jgi:hypothetical protein
MAGQIKVNQVQLGDSLTATRNFVWQTNVDGTAKLARGNVGATTQDILTVDANGRVAFPQSVAVLKVNRSASFALTSGVQAAVNCDVKEVDTLGAYNNTASPVILNGVSVPAYSFLPLITGYYQVSGRVFMSGTNLTYGTCRITKNGANAIEGSYLGVGVGAAAGEAHSNVAGIIQMNGTTDYISLVAQSAGTSPLVSVGGVPANYTFFHAVLVAKA